jgi:membrane associated rhomboid family serine protease
MIPLRDENPSRTVPIANTVLILANISVFIYQNFLVSCGAEQLFLRLGFIPYELSHGVDIDPPALVPLPLTVLTAMFMHGGWIHLLSNMLFLWIFRDNVEDKLGPLRYLSFYLICGISASLSHVFTNLNSQIPSIGSSGAIAGVMGAYMVLFPGARIRTLLILGIFIQIVRIPAVLVLGYWILIQVLSGLAGFGPGTGGGIAWFAHIGGFIAGFSLVTVMKKSGKKAHRGK